MQASGPYVRLYSSVWCVWCVETVGVLAVFPDSAEIYSRMPYIAYRSDLGIGVGARLARGCADTAHQTSPHTFLGALGTMLSLI